MKEKELKRLGRAELLELLLSQTKETERLQAELERLEAELADKRLRVQQAGSLAQAVMDLNGVFEAAQAAAQQYLDNIAEVETETRQRCEKMLSEAEAEAERIIFRAVSKAEEEVEAVRRRTTAAVEWVDTPEHHLPGEAFMEEIYELLGEENGYNR